MSAVITRAEHEILLVPDPRPLPNQLGNPEKAPYAGLHTYTALADGGASVARTAAFGLRVLEFGRDAVVVLERDEWEVEKVSVRRWFEVPRPK